MSILENLGLIQEEIELSCQSCGRNSKEVLLMPVVKTIDEQRIIEVFKAGYSIIGENRVQEVIKKEEKLQPYPHQVHLIGHLQTNKVKDILGHITCLQSLDSLKLAEKLQNRLDFLNLDCLKVLIEVNTSGESAKSGINPDYALQFLEDLQKYPKLQIEGFMTIGALEGGESKTRECFKNLRIIRDKAAQKFPKLNLSTLSMGMSGDFSIAIQEGSNLVRVGTRIFGMRN